jgi:hypothetical protein
VNGARRLALHRHVPARALDASADSADRRQVACKDPRFIARFSSPLAAPAPRALAAREYTIF